MPLLLSNVIVSPYGDGDREMDVAITSSRDLLRVWDRFHAAILSGYESPALDCSHTRVKELLAQVSVSTLLSPSTSIPHSVHADHQALLCAHMFTCRAPIAVIVGFLSLIFRTLILKVDFYHDEQT